MVPAKTMLKRHATCFSDHCQLIFFLAKNSFTIWLNSFFFFFCLDTGTHKKYHFPLERKGNRGSSRLNKSEEAWSLVEMPSVSRRLVVTQSWHGAWYKRVYMWFLISLGSRDVWIWWSQPTLPLSVWCAPISILDCFSSSFCAWFLYFRYWVVCCGHRVGVLLVVGVEGGQATHVVCCAESQITDSPPLLSDCADYRLTATAVWLGHFVWNGTWGT